MIQFTIPIRTKNPLNGSQGRTKGAIYGKATRRKKERQAAWAACLNSLGRGGHGNVHVGAGVVFVGDGVSRVFGVRLTVTIRRVSSGTLDGDGLQAATKSIRDGLADALGINDGSDAVRWLYEQRKCKRGLFSVEVEIS